jgi:hypothetical protein
MQSVRPEVSKGERQKMPGSPGSVKSFMKNGIDSMK